GDRVAVATASTLIRPDSVCGLTDATPGNMTCTSPLMSAFSADVAPRYETRTMFTFAMDLKSSLARWLVVPGAAVLKLSSPGRDRASAIRSLTDFTGSDGWT